MLPDGTGAAEQAGPLDGADPDDGGGPAERVLAVWLRGRNDFARTFLVLAPNVIVYERLRADSQIKKVAVIRLRSWHIDGND